MILSSSVASRCFSCLLIMVAMAGAQVSPPEGNTLAVDSSLRDAHDTAVTSVGSEADSLGAMNEELGPEAGFETSKAEVLLPLDGDIFHTSSLRLVARLFGPPPSSIGMLVNGYPADGPITMGEGILTAEITGLYSGMHRVTLLLFDESMTIVVREERSFYVRIPEPERLQTETPLRQFGRVVTRAEFRGGEAGARIDSYRKLRIRESDSLLVGGSRDELLAQNFDGVGQAVYNLVYDRWEANGRVLLRSTETEYRQPAHRFTGSMKYRPWVSARLGDLYPVMNPLVLRDQRVRGGEGVLRMVTGDTRWGALQVVHGQSRRPIPAHLIEVESGDSLLVRQVPGTYAQSISAARLGLGGGRAFDMGFTVLKAGEDVSSLDPVINDTLRGQTPLDNLVSGFDMRLAFYEGRLQFFADAALSLLTKNKAIGALDTADTELDLELPVNPSDWEDIFVFNTTTQGITYLFENENVDASPGEFLSQISAYNIGVKTSFPLDVLSTETELVYSHLGGLYSSEGNPYLGAHPEDGFQFLQKVRTLENRLGLGIEMGSYRQTFGLLNQLQRNMKAELRYTPGSQLPGFWMGGGQVRSVPEERLSRLQTATTLSSFFSGGYHRFRSGPLQIHAWLQYSFSQSDLEITRDSLPDTTSSVRANVLTTSLQFKQRSSNLVPRLAYTFASNGIQQPTHNMVFGFHYAWMDRRMVLDASLQVGQYPENSEVNDLKLGETVDFAYHFSANQSLKLRERWIQYGKRRNIIAGLYYDVTF